MKFLCVHHKIAVVTACFFVFPAVLYKTHPKILTYPAGLCYDNEVVALSPLVVKITKNYIARKIKNQDVEPVLSYDETLNAEAAAKADN